MDDTNPAKEDTEYVDAIQEDIHWLGFDWGDRFYYGSDYFEQTYELAEDLIQRGLAYVCELTPEQLKQMALLAKKQRAERRRPVITLRVSPATLEKAKATGKGYTGFMSRLLDLAINNPEMVKRCL